MLSCSKLVTKNSHSRVSIVTAWPKDVCSCSKQSQKFAEFWHQTHTGKERKWNMKAAMFLCGHGQQAANVCHGKARQGTIYNYVGGKGSHDENKGTTETWITTRRKTHHSLLSRWIRLGVLIKQKHNSTSTKVLASVIWHFSMFTEWYT